MAKIGFLLTEGPWQTENHKVFTKLASAALDAGHEVQAFWYLDGVYNPIKHQKFPGVEEDELLEVSDRVVIFRHGHCDGRAVAAGDLSIADLRRGAWASAT